MPYVMRDEYGKINGVFSGPQGIWQDGIFSSPQDFATEYLPDDNPELVIFLNCRLTEALK